MFDFHTYVDANRERFIEELQDFCRQPSVSAQNMGMEEMALKVLARFQKLGAEAWLIPTGDGPPVVYAEIGQGQRTLLIYDHYDVQPLEPLELWESGPWEAVIRNGKFFARGASDNKGELLVRIQAIEAYLAAVGPLPLKIKFVVEGEEEVGSPHLLQFVSENRALVQDADGCLWEAGNKDVDERPRLSCGLKGIVYVELHAHGANQDLHSALGAIVTNPAWRLTWALATLKDAQDNIIIDDFAEHVCRANEFEIEALRAIPFDEEKIKAQYGISTFINDLSGVELLTKYLYEPSCTICGLHSGYAGPGTKTVLPGHAFARIDFRLVPDLTPDLVVRLLRAHLARRGFNDIEVRNPLWQEEVARPPVNSKIVRAAVEAAREVYGVEPALYPTLAGSGPMYPLCHTLGIPVVSAGSSWYDARTHAPNESIRIADYFQGILFIRELIDRFAVI